jgi:hypothetical protein
LLVMVLFVGSAGLASAVTRALLLLLLLLMLLEL